VIFDEKLEESTDIAGSLYFEPAVSIAKGYFTNRSLREILLVLGSPLKGGQPYTLFAQNIRDCAGNPVQTGNSQVLFALPEPADSLDVLVNEVLFNRAPKV